MKKVLMIGNNEISIYNFRSELIDEMIKDNYEVYISLPYGSKVELLKEKGCKFLETPIEARNTNVLEDIKLFFRYIRILDYVKPNIVLTYTVKPNLYGGIACRLMGIPYVCNITGVGSGYLRGGLVKYVIKILSKVSFKKAYKVFFQNSDDMSKFLHDKNENYDLLPGSGVNLKSYKVMEYPLKSEKIIFNFIARVMKDKGIDEYLEAAAIIKSKYSNIDFNVIGLIQEKYYEDILHEYEEKGIIKYHGFQDDIKSFINVSSCTINPSYSEGMSNVLLEAAACGRPIIASNIPGCREIIDDNITGYTVEPKSVSDLVEKIEKFINTPYEQKIKMGLAGRQKVEKHFDRNIVVNKYMRLIKDIDKNSVLKKEINLRDKVKC